MTNTKQEELKKLLVSADFKEESYESVPTQELIILKNSAMSMKEKNVKVQQAALFFTKREEFFYHLVLRRLQKIEVIYTLFTKATNLPYVYCDPDTCNDQVWIFSEESFAKKSALKEMQNKRELLVVKLENKQFLSFYMSLYAMGVNELLLDGCVNKLAVERETLVRKPEYSKLPPEKQPVSNPELQLTAIYFAQERNMPEESRDNGNLRDLEEEMLVNLHRGKLLMPVQVPEESGEKVQVQDMKLPLLKLPNGNAYHPICTDPNEFQKFNRKNEFRAITVDCAKLNQMIGKNEEVKGIILNPASVRLAVPKEKLG